MISLLVYSFVTFAIAWIVGHAHITFKLRKALIQSGAIGEFLVTLLECAGCVGFWIGFAAFALHLAPAELTTWWQSALFTSTSSLVLLRLSGMDTQ